MSEHPTPIPCQRLLHTLSGMRHYRRAAIVLYRMMMDAHLEHYNGELHWKQKQYLWGLATEVAERGRFTQLFQVRHPMTQQLLTQPSGDLPRVSKEAELRRADVMQVIHSGVLPWDERTDDPRDPQIKN